MLLVGISHGDECHAFHAFGESEDVAGGLGVEAAYPACCQSGCCSGQADVLGGYREVYVGVVLAVRGAVPGLVMDAAAGYQHGSGDEGGTALAEEFLA